MSNRVVEVYTKGQEIPTVMPERDWNENKEDWLSYGRIAHVVTFESKEDWHQARFAPINIPPEKVSWIQKTIGFFRKGRN